MNNSIGKIRSSYILNEISTYLQQKKLLEIVRYNKQLKKKLEIKLEDYKKVFSKIVIEIIPVENALGKFINTDLNKNSKNYFHSYFNGSKEEIKRNEIIKDDKVDKIKVVIDYEIKSFYKLFNEINTIKKINFIRFDRKDIKNMSSMFYNCSSLEEINFNKFNTDKVIDMSFMFFRCSSLKKLDLIKFNTINATNMCGMFFGCSSLRKLDLSKFITIKTRNMCAMFFECSSLKELNFINFKNINDIRLDSIFYGCTSLEELKCQEQSLKNQYEKLNTNIDDMFIISLKY